MLEKVTPVTTTTSSEDTGTVSDDTVTFTPCTDSNVGYNVMYAEPSPTPSTFAPLMRAMFGESEVNETYFVTSKSRIVDKSVPALKSAKTVTAVAWYNGLH
jgi:hypothetical protein